MRALKLKSVSNIVLLILLSFSLLECSTPQKLIDQEQYSLAFDALIKKGQNGRLNAEQLMQLKQAYHAANQLDHERITSLKASGSPDIWPDVLYHLKNIQQRTKAVQRLSPDLKRQLDLKPVNVDEEVLAAKITTTQYYNRLAEKLLVSEDPDDSRKALPLFEKVQQLNPAYPGLDRNMRRAVFTIADRLLIGFKNESGVQLPTGFADQVLSQQAFSNSPWQSKIIWEPDQGLGNTYQIVVVLNDIEVSPHKTGQTTFTEKMESFQAEVIRYELQKSVSLSGQIQIIANNGKQPLIISPFNVSSKFEYTYARFSGDEKALTEATRELTKKAALPYPSDESLLKDAAAELNKTVALLLK
jgi:hypothetical protein